MLRPVCFIHLFRLGILEAHRSLISKSKLLEIQWAEQGKTFRRSLHDEFSAESPVVANSGKAYEMP